LVESASGNFAPSRLYGLIKIGRVILEEAWIFN
jgi:hypothetical protein